MNISFEYHEVTASDRLEQLATEKLQSLGVKYNFITSAIVHFKQETVVYNLTSMNVGIRVEVPGMSLFAESSKDRFNKAIIDCTSQLERQLAKRKETLKTY